MWLLTPSWVKKTPHRYTRASGALHVTLISTSSRPGRSMTSYDTTVAFERITIDPSRMGGVPCIRDLRITVSLVLGQMAGDSTIEELLIDYPYLVRADVPAALEYAAAIVNEREVRIARPA